MANKKRVQLWVDALRSGKYKQARGRLETSGGEYCCLGVACDVAIANGIDIDRQVSKYGAVRYGETTSVLPRKVAAWFGFEESSPAVTVNEDFSAEVTCVFLNDDLHYNFNQIADAVSRDYLKED